MTMWRQDKQLHAFTVLIGCLMAWPLRSLFFNWTPAVDSGICATRIDLQLLHPYEPMNIPGLWILCIFSHNENFPGSLAPGSHLPLCTDMDGFSSRLHFWSTWVKWCKMCKKCLTREIGTGRGSVKLRQNIVCHSHKAITWWNIMSAKWVSFDFGICEGTLCRCQANLVSQSKR